MGHIGNNPHEVEFEPLPDETVPEPERVPAEPVKEPEKVPA